ncbi:hypothetical protein EG835_08705, partial [bacterium]|nr:hypothetical protein [bacterium]
MGIRRDGGVIVLDGRSGQGTLGSLALRRALPFALALRGHVVLHASAVEAGGGAVAFVGESGIGKSTLARELGALGCRVLSDDLLRVEPRGPRVLVPAGHSGGRRTRWVPLREVFFLARSADLAAPAAQSLGAVEFLGLLVRNGFGELRLPEVWALQLAVYHR